MTTQTGFLPYGRHVIDEDDIAAVVDALRSDYLTTGPRVGIFEQDLAQATGARHAIACSNGTAALPDSRAKISALAKNQPPAQSAVRTVAISR